jgi:hypothetical protein
MSVKRVSRSALVVAILLTGLGYLIATPAPASAAPGKVAAGAATFTGLGGSLQVGSGAVPVNVPTLHPDRPAQCADGVDNEVGSRYSSWPGAYSTRSVTDANTSSGGFTLTSATAAFTAADIGRTVEDSAATILPAGTTITAINSGVSVQISQAALTTTPTGAITIRDSIVNATDGLIDNGTDGQCTTAGDDDEAMSFFGTGGGFQNTALCDNQTNFPANPQPRVNWSLPSTVTVASAATNNVSITPSAVTVPDNVLLQGTTQLAGLQLQVLQSVKPIAFNTAPPRGNYNDPCARTFTDGSTTIGNPNLTSATQAQFQGAGFQSDLTQFVSGPGIAPNTTIVTRTSATAVVMSQNATATLAGQTVTIGGHGGTNGQTTAGSNIFTGNGFSALDIGGLLWATNVPAGTTITSVISGTQVVMSNNATLGGTTLPYTAAGKPYTTTCAGGAYVGKTNWFGVSNSDGSGSLDICVYVEINLHENSNPDTIAPNDVICRTDAFPIHLTTGTDGALTGVPYDTTKQTTTMVATNFTIPQTTAAVGATLGQLVCDGVNSQVGFPSGPANNALSMVTSTKTGPWPPVAATVTPAGLSVNEGDVVNLTGDFANSYDPGSRPLTEVGWARTGGTASAPAATQVSGSTTKFVAQDAPAGGNTHVYNYCVSAPLIASSSANSPTNNSPETGCKTTTVTVNNVAPVATAGPNRTVNGGQVVALTGTSTDPGDADIPGERGYCWTQTGGVSVGLPACTGSPSNNRPSSLGKFTALNFTPTNANDTKTFQLVVTDNDGGTSSPSSTTITTRATSAATISGTVRGCTPACVGTAGIPVKLFQDGIGFVGSTTTAAGGAYSFTNVTNTFSATPQGSNEFPTPSGVTTTGNVSISINAATNLVCHNAAGVSGLTGPITGNHIHSGAAGTNGSIVVDFGTNLTSCVTAAPATVTSILANPSLFYFNMHTAAHPGGETRGQLSSPANYRVQFAAGTGFIMEWWNDAALVTEGDAITPPSAIIDADVYSNALAGKTISGTVSLTGGGSASNGTSVRLYDESGFVASTTTSGGTYAFSSLQPKNTYKVDFARGSATLAETWSGGAFSAPTATAVDVTAGNAVVNITLNAKGIAANGQGNIAGTVTDGGSGIAGIQVRAYDFTTGAWIASVTTDGAGNYTFAGTNFGTNVNGLAPGGYKLWFWNVAQSGPGGGNVWCSVWDSGNLAGGQYQGSGKLVTTPVNVTANTTTTDNKVLVANTTAVCPK